MNLPGEIISGLTYEWTEVSSKYPSSDGWTCKLCPVGPTVVTPIVAEENDNGEDYDFTLTAVVSGAMLGVYEFSLVVTKGSGPTLEQHLLEMVRQEVKYNPLNPGTYDGRSVVKQTLDAINASLLGAASKDQLSYTINNRSLARYTLTERLALQAKYQRLYNKELRAEKIANGQDPGRKIFVRFTDV